MPSIVALIPARCGSQRVPGKNVKLLGGRPLIAWSISAALESGIFSAVVLATDSAEYGRIGADWGASVYLREPSGNDESDITWLAKMPHLRQYDAFALLRPTSPFRTADTIRRAWGLFLTSQPADSLRAVEPVRQHPGKMWVVRQNRMLPLLPWECAVSPWHSSATQTLPRVYMQNASLEIAWTRTVWEQHTIAGTAVIPFVTEGCEGFDINEPRQYDEAKRLVDNQLI